MGNFLGKLFGGGGKNPADAGMPYLNRIGPMAQQNLQPWQQQGQQAQQQNQQQFSSMATNPADFLEQLRASYTPSGGYKFKQDQMEKAARGAAGAGGWGRSPAHQQQIAQLTKDLLSEDEGAYIDRLLGIQGTGLQGNEQIANRGYNAAGDLTNIQGSTLGSQGQLAYKGQENQNAAKAAAKQQLYQLLAAGAGFAVGGPAGAVVGNQVAGGSAQHAPVSNAQMYGKSLPGVGSPSWGGNY